MNSLSRGYLLTRVASSKLLLAQRSTLPKILLARSIQTQNISLVSATEPAPKGDSKLKRIFTKYNLFNLSDIKLKQAGYVMYETVADKISYTDFFLEFKMSDSFFSWFLITELHVWMLMVRTMAEKEEGKIVRNSMVEAFWGDCTTRAKVLWIENPGGVRKQVQELSEQFNCAMIGYDEGVHGDDKILAGAIWRRFFQSERNNPEDIEKLLIYIRKQIIHLDKIPAAELLSKPNIKWLPLNDH